MNDKPLDKRVSHTGRHNEKVKLVQIGDKPFSKGRSSTCELTPRNVHSLNNDTARQTRCSFGALWGESRALQKRWYNLQLETLARRKVNSTKTEIMDFCP